MVEPGFCKLMAAYNRWMNTSIYDHCARLTPAQLCEERGAFFGSILGTLSHLLVVDRLWLARFAGETPAATPLDTIVHDDLKRLRQARESVDGDISRWAGQVTPGWLNDTQTFVSVADGQRYNMPGWVMASHLFNHQAHHRGQVTTLMTQAGIDPGVTDLARMPRTGG